MPGMAPCLLSGELESIFNPRFLPRLLPQDGGAAGVRADRVHRCCLPRAASHYPQPCSSLLIHSDFPIVCSCPGQTNHTCRFTLCHCQAMINL